MHGIILDLEHVEKNRLKLMLTDSNPTEAYDEFDPYFYLMPEDNAEKTAKQIMERFSESVKKVTIEEKSGLEVLKIVTTDPSKVPEIKHEIREYGETREDDIPYIFRYLIDKNLFASRQYEFKITKGRLAEAVPTEEKKLELSTCAFDIETYNKFGISDAKRDPVLMIGYCDGEEKKVFWWDKTHSSEKEVIEKFVEKVAKKDPDVIVGYASANFDFPYLKKRSGEIGAFLALGRDKSEVKVKKGGLAKNADIFGRAHIDAFDGVEFLTGIGALRLPKNDLDSIYKEFCGKRKVPIEKREIYKLWERGGKDLEKLIEYNQEDAVAAFEVGKHIIPLYLELSKIIGLPIYEVSGMATSQMIEWLLIREAHVRNELVPKRVDEPAVRERMMNPIKGAFVKLPEPGLHENIAVCDFRSLYPSLIISYNVSPDTLDCGCCKDAFAIPEVGHRFCKKKKGIMPKILEELINARVEVKKQVKKHDKKSHEYQTLHFRQWALKILANSGYGYLGYGRSRWYCREAAESVTALGRHYVIETGEKAEKAGFQVLYQDTDSIFLKMNSKTKKDVETFIESINKSLPEKMELELQGIYPRGLFVTKREGGAAKKRYALIREDGTVEIKGFEFVRRDWANIAKVAQEKVIEAVLHEGNPEKAVKTVKKVIAEVQAGKATLDDVTIYEQLTKSMKDYEQMGPHVRAAQRLNEAGVKTPPGFIVEYVITKGTGSIADRAIPLPLLNERPYDPDYYIDNQIMPAVMKILRELGVKEDSLKGKEQAGLHKWM